MTVNKNIFDVIIIGSGIAGISIATELSKESSVCILEKENITSYHSTGRSFAFYIESYGNEIIRKLTSSSKDFFINNSNIDNQNSILRPRGVLHLASDKQSNDLLESYKELTKINKNLNLLDSNETLKILPCLNEKYINSSIHDYEACDIDVNFLYNIYLNEFKKNKGSIKTNIKINNVLNKNNDWQINCQSDTFYCKLVINAAGAWCDEVANIFNAKPINIVPKKRTVFCFKPLNIEVKNNWPVAVDVNENFYFKLENQTLLGSPADETNTIPHDAQADEIDIAVGADRIEKATKFKFKSIINKWAGLRCFVKDKTPVIGYDTEVENFFWIAGQGGYGIQTSPALSKIASNLILKKSNSIYEEKFKIDLDLLNIKRLK